MQWLRVLILSAHPRGGWHHYTAALCNALVRHPEVVATQYLMIYREQRLYGVGQEEDDILDPAVDLAYLAPAGLLSPPRKYLLFLRNLVRWLRQVWEGAYDVIHVQTGTPGSRVFNLALLLWFKMAGVVVVRTVHEVYVPWYADRAGALAQWCAQLELQLADHLIVHDDFTRHCLSRTWGREEDTMTVIPHGNYLGFRKYIPQGYDEAQAYRDSRRVVVLFFGLKRHKGLAVFLQAWRMVQAEGHPYEALLIGTPLPEDADLVEEARRLPGIEIQAKYIPNAQLWAYFDRSTFVVMPYLAGMTSGAVHLAYAFRRPVIASDLDCFKEMVIPGKTGLVVPRGDAIALKEAMVQLGQDQGLCTQMGEAGLQRESSQCYRWETIADQTIAVYRQVRKV